MNNDPWTPQPSSSIASTNTPQTQLDDFLPSSNQYSSGQQCGRYNQYTYIYFIFEKITSTNAWMIIIFFSSEATGSGTTTFDLSSLENGLAMSGVANSSNKNLQNTTNNLRKTPQSFLGENSGLVNLDKLITTPTIPPLPTTVTKSSK